MSIVDATYLVEDADGNIMDDGVLGFHHEAITPDGQPYFALPDMSDYPLGTYYVRITVEFGP